MSLQIHGLIKRFGSQAAVAGVSLAVEPARMLVLLGPSGCGKTTIMRCVAGLEQPDAGRIEIGGRAVFDSEAGVNVPVHQRNVGMVFQSYAIWPHMSVRENVAFPLEMQNRPAAETREQVADMLAVVGLGEMAERGASQLSGGQMQRVALARSLVMRPAVLLFDEPLSNLDATLRDHLRIELRELQTRFSITSVFVTHDQQEALALADEVAVMQAGHVLQRDDPVTIYHRPRSSTVAAFIGYRNVFPVEVTGAGPDGARFRMSGIDAEFRAASPPPGGEDLFACIRPGDIGIARIEDDRPLPANTMTGEVTLASFMGSHIHHRVRRDDGASVEIFDARIPSDIRVGCRVALTLDPASILLLPRTAP